MPTSEHLPHRFHDEFEPWDENDDGRSADDALRAIAYLQALGRCPAGLIIPPWWNAASWPNGPYQPQRAREAWHLIEGTATSSTFTRAVHVIFEHAVREGEQGSVLPGYDLTMRPRWVKFYLHRLHSQQQTLAERAPLEAFHLLHVAEVPHWRGASLSVPAIHPWPAVATPSGDPAPFFGA